MTSKGVGFWVSVFLVLSLTITLANLESTLRSADPARRGKIKFLLLGIGSILVFQLYTHSQYLLFPRLEQDFSAVQSSILFIACLLVTFSLVRHQLMDVDVFVSRDFVYQSFTVGAVGVYLLVVGLAGQAIKSVGGIPTLYLKSLFVFLTVLFLVAVLLSHSVQKRVKIFIERNFYRHRYDYHEEWLALTDKLSSKVEVKDLIPVIANMFLQTLWIENTRLWLYDDREKEFQAVKTSQGEPGAPIRWEPGLLDALRERDYPIPIDELKDLAGGTGIDPGQMKAFREMGIAILSPLIIKSRFVGILGLSGTMSKYPLDQEDYDLVRTVSKQVAGSFLNARLSRELLQAKEMETFHAFSAFVIHDLKNFVSMLSLVVHNAKGNFEDPEFRADALQSISQTADKMKRMMDRLAVLSRPMEVERTRTDLNDVARGALSELNGALGSKVAAEFGTIPALAIDPVQMKKVVTNLLLNAAEASGAKAGHSPLHGAGRRVGRPHGVGRRLRDDPGVHRGAPVQAVLDHEERRLRDRAVPGEGDRRGARGEDRGRKRRGARLLLPGPAAEGTPEPGRSWKPQNSRRTGTDIRTGTFLRSPVEAGMVHAPLGLKTFLRGDYTDDHNNGTSRKSDTDYSRTSGDGRHGPRGGLRRTTKALNQAIKRNAGRLDCLAR